MTHTERCAKSRCSRIIPARGFPPRPTGRCPKAKDWRGVLLSPAFVPGAPVRHPDATTYSFVTITISGAITSDITSVNDSGEIVETYATVAGGSCFEPSGRILAAPRQCRVRTLGRQDRINTTMRAGSPMDHAGDDQRLQVTKLLG